MIIPIPLLVHVQLQVSVLFSGLRLQATTPIGTKVGPSCALRSESRPP